MAVGLGSALMIEMTQPQLSFLELQTPLRILLQILKLFPFLISRLITLNFLISMTFSYLSFEQFADF